MVLLFFSYNVWAVASVPSFETCSLEMFLNNPCLNILLATILEVAPPLCLAGAVPPKFSKLACNSFSQKISHYVCFTLSLWLQRNPDLTGLNLSLNLPQLILFLSLTAPHMCLTDMG